MRVRYALLLLSLFNLPAQAADSKVIDADAGCPEGPLMKDGTLYYAFKIERGAAAVCPKRP